jgi:hypothetical protein
MAYTSEKPKLVPDTETLRQTVPGWGVDLDPRDRPAVPKERFNLANTGAHWHFPDRQQPTYARERSTEHKFLTPVFGTVCPPRGVSGLVRRWAYTFSEGQTSHWMLLILADRIDVMEGNLADVLRLKGPRPIKEMGLRSEVKYHGLRSRTGQHRNDNKHLPVDVLMFAAKGLLTGALLAGVGAAVGGAAIKAVFPKKRGLFAWI